MAIPPNIPAVSLYQFHNIPSQNGFVLGIGNSVKDLPNGSETEMKKRCDDTKLHIHNQNQAEKADYDKNLASANERADQAKLDIVKPTKQLNIAIACLVTSILLTLGVVLAAVLTTMWPIAFAAIPFIAGVIAASVKTDEYAGQVTDLNRTINAPSNMAPPRPKTVAEYEKGFDLDLASSRMAAVNDLARRSIVELAQTRWTDKQIADYALLDGISKDRNDAFYAKTFKLMNNYKMNEQAHIHFEGQLRAQYTQLQHELNLWKSANDRSLNDYERQLDMRQYNQYRPSVVVAPAITPRGHLTSVAYVRRPNALDFTLDLLETMDINADRGRLANNRRQLDATYGTLQERIRVWHRDCTNSLASSYQAAVGKVQQEYQAICKT